MSLVVGTLDADILATATESAIEHFSTVETQPLALAFDTGRTNSGSLGARLGIRIFTYNYYVRMLYKDADTQTQFVCSEIKLEVLGVDTLHRHPASTFIFHINCDYLDLYRDLDCIYSSDSGIDTGGATSLLSSITAA